MDSVKPPTALSLSSVLELLHERGSSHAVIVHEGTRDGVREALLEGITIDSREANERVAWAAVRGFNAHGAEFARDALKAGTAAIVTDREGVRIIRALAHEHGTGLPMLIESSNPRALAAIVADIVHGSPSAHMRVIGVTGTNGKTSVSTMIAGTLRALGHGVGLVGTNGTFVWDADGHERTVATVRTTPEATELHGLLREMLDSQARFAAVEVSSHAMVLHRADAVRFDVAVFTNLSQDHLDFHADMEDYWRAKASLFTGEHAASGIVCVDDEWGQRVAREARIPVVTYASLPGRGADIEVLETTSLGYSSRILARDHRFGTTLELTSPLPGRHYVANTVAVALVLEHCGWQRGSYEQALAQAGRVAGRMERISLSDVSDAQLPRVVVDYSHTPDALEKTLSTMRALPGVRTVVSVVGAGGQRDTSKRGPMGAVASTLSDVVIVTDDNPRGEDPALIRRAVVDGAVEAATNGQVVLENGDRAAAIVQALRYADVGDVVLIAGKGAETGQDFGDHVEPFDDREHARAALRAWHEGKARMHA